MSLKKSFRRYGVLLSRWGTTAMVFCFQAGPPIHNRVGLKAGEGEGEGEGGRWTVKGLQLEASILWSVMSTTKFAI